MDKLKMHSPDLIAGNILKLAALFPNCTTVAIDDKTGQTKKVIDFDRLRQELNDHIVEGQRERYQLDWPGKKQGLLAANAPIAKTLRPKRDESVDFDKTQNLFIEGDNLDALKLLQETYLGKIKLIYIDPPYNTGKDFVYRDNYSEGTIAHQVASGDVSDAGEKLVTNPETDGRFHSNWLTMFAARLKLARNLLTSDGAIFVSCDEGEHPRVRLVMDEIFGERNFVADMVWAAGRKNDSKYVSVSHEYIVCYARDMAWLRENKIEWKQRKKGLAEIYSKHQELVTTFGADYLKITQALKLWYKQLPESAPAKAHEHYSTVDCRGVYFPDNISWPGGGGPKYEVLHPVTRKPVKIPSRGWIVSEQRMKEWIAEDKVHFGQDENSVPCVKRYLKDTEMEAPYSVFYQDGRAASKRLRTLMGGDVFDFPKDELVLKELIEMVTTGDDIVLDFFAGSSTTAHATMLQNAADGQNRRFIMVQIPHKPPEDSEARKAGYQTISAISRERIRRAGAAVLKGDVMIGWKQDTGFRALEVDSSNMTDNFYTPDKTNQDDLLSLADNIKPDRSSEDLLFQILVDWGLDLALPISCETIAGKKVHFIDGNSVAACFEKQITEDLVREIAKRKPLRVVFRDDSYQNDSLKINVDQIFKHHSPETDVKAI
jgi:adenine-specific DNA-methyltransferase